MREGPGQDTTGEDELEGTVVTIFYAIVFRATGSQKSVEMFSHGLETRLVLDVEVVFLQTGG